MCGIFGVVVPENIFIRESTLKKALKDLFLLSESRGKEAAGLSIRTGGNIYVLKRPVSASVLVKSSDYKKLTDKALTNSKDDTCRGVSIIGHSRMVTNGSQKLHDNNQPIIRDGIVGIHNGIVVNERHLWSKYPLMERKFNVDSEVILSLFNMFYSGDKSLCRSFVKTFREIEGYASAALMFSCYENLLIGTNNGSLYYVQQDGLLIFCSEELMLKKLILKGYLRRRFKNCIVQHVEPGNAYLLNMKNGKADHFPLGIIEKLAVIKEIPAGKKAKIVDDKSGNYSPVKEKEAPPPQLFVPTSFMKDFEYFSKAIEALKRCTRCILPETMPFIEFDDEGVCNYCRRYKKRELIGEDALKEIFNKQRRQDSRPDSIVMLSGGRDSSYMLYYVRDVLKMNPIAYTYDWGMVTDLARRNISRLCGKLKVEHLLISANIPKKRKYVRKNVLAWLKKPHIGVIPLFMAGDKIYFHFVHKLRRDLGLDIIVSGRNRFENTVFKHGFSGVIENYKTKPYTFSFLSKMKVLKYYAGQFLSNPGYWNISVIDSFIGFLAAYFLDHDYVFFYDYIRWDENAIIQILKEYFDWETASDTDTTWRIGDGTASFYNYIYYTVAGMSEIDTFQSNKIREGEVTREKALKIAEKYNQPRFESIKWYCDTIGIEFISTLERINEIPKLYNY